MRSFGTALLILLTNSFVGNSVTHSQEKKDEKRPRLFQGGLIKRFEDLQTRIKKDREEKRKAREKQEAQRKKAEAEKKLREKQLRQTQRNSGLRSVDPRDPAARQDAADSSRRNDSRGLRLPKIDSSKIAPQFDPEPTANAAKVELGLDVKPSGIGSTGLIIEKIEKSGPAAAAGLKARDRITSVGGSPIRKIDDLDLIMGAFEPGDRTEIEFVRAGKKEKTLVEFPAGKNRGIASLNAPQGDSTEELPTPNANPRAPRKSESPLPSADNSIRVLPLVQGPANGRNQPKNGKVVGTGRAGIGVTAVPVDPPLFARQNLSVRQGAYLEVISKGSAAEKSGLKPGDVVIAVDGRKVDSAISMAELIQTYQPGESASLLYYRGNRLRRTEIVMDEIQNAPPLSGRAEVARNSVPRELGDSPNRNSILGELSNEFPRLKRIDDMIERFSNQPTKGSGSSVQYNRTRRELELENEVQSLRQRLRGQDRQIKDLNEKLNLIEKLLKKNQ